MMSYAPSLKVKAAATLELRRRIADRAAVRWTDPAVFIGASQIAMPYGDGAALVPFDLWPRQRAVLDRMMHDRLLMLLKARQIGMTWLTCGYVLYRCMQRAGRTVLMFSQGQLEANELIDRIRLMHTTHAEALPPLTTDNTTELEWGNGSRIKSLPATRKAGRSFTASIVVLDEFAFMTWGQSLLAAVKPTIDNGGQLIILSSADGQGSAFHQFWQAASAGQNGYTPLFLDWRANPTRDDGWRDARMIEGLEPADVLREYPENDIEAFTAAAGQVYDVWSDGPEGGNVTEAAEFLPDGGPVLLAVDDGYVGEWDTAIGHYTATSHPRVFLWCQLRANGQLCVFNESFAVKTLSEQHIVDAMAMGYPLPDYVAIDKSAAELRNRFHAIGLYTRGCPATVEESIKEARRWVASDVNGFRRLLVHPRCKHIRYEFTAYRYDQGMDKPIKQHDHAMDAIRYLIWTLRYE